LSAESDAAGKVAGSIPILGSVYNFVATLGGLVKGPTKHASFTVVYEVAWPLAQKFDGMLRSLLTAPFPGNPSLTQYQALTVWCAEEAAKNIEANGWWRNSTQQRWQQIVKDMRSDPTVVGTLWRTMQWAFQCDGEDNWTLAYSAVNEVYTHCLYLLLPNLGYEGSADIQTVIDASVAKACKVSPQHSASDLKTILADAAAQAGKSVVSKFTDWITSLFGGSTADSATSTTKAGFSGLSILLLVGAGIGSVYALWKKRII
jgi:hypothetical protein